MAQRQSARIAAKSKGAFIETTTLGQAMRRKALLNLNSLFGCSAGLKKQVVKRNILSRNKLPVGVSDLRKLVTAAGVGCKTVDVIGVRGDGLRCTPGLSLLLPRHTSLRTLCRLPAVAPGPSSPLVSLAVWPPYLGYV